MKNFLFGIVLILVSCNGQKKTIVESVNSKVNLNSSLELIVQDEYSGFEIEETVIIKDQKRLKSFYSKLNMTRKPGLQVPSIDFSKEMVIIHCSGELNYTGVSELALSEETSTQVILDSKVERDSGDASRTVKTNLFCIYKMSTTEKDIVIEKGLK